jgi:hypothetical protein
MFSAEGEKLLFLHLLPRGEQGVTTAKKNRPRRCGQEHEMRQHGLGLFLLLA